MSKKVILEMSIYTDGDWKFDKSIFENYVSKYFDNDLYEYTYIYDYGCKIRRTFEDINSGFTQIASILEELTNSISSKDDFTENKIKAFFHNQIKMANSKLEFESDIDGNTEIEVEVSIIDSDSKPIKNIIYESCREHP